MSKTKKPNTELMKKSLGKLSMQTLSEKNLLKSVLKQLEGREAFKDADEDINEKIYHGDVFSAILGELSMIQGTSDYPSNDVIEQLEILNELVSADYLLVTYPL